MLGLLIWRLTLFLVLENRYLLVLLGIVYKAIIFVGIHRLFQVFVQKTGLEMVKFFLINLDLDFTIPRNSNVGVLRHVVVNSGALRGLASFGVGSDFHDYSV